MLKMKLGNIELVQIDEMIWEIPKSGGMKVSGRIYLSKEMIENSLGNDEALKQVVNVAHLPGIEKYSIAMPDIHWGYGFPIGGVAATNLDEGVISPGGVGYDINCGVRLAVVNLKLDEIKNNLNKLVGNLFNNIPTGVGAKGAIKKLSKSDLMKLTKAGSNWAIEKGFGDSNDLDFTEENGRMKNADPEIVSIRAIERGLDQLGTLGSGNHFLEIGFVDEIYDEKTAKIFGLCKNQITILIHTGSRGYGYQICDDFLKSIIKNENKYGFALPDKQLACAPINSEDGKNYLSAMSSAANYAWNNRQVIMSLAKKTFLSTLNISEQDLGFKLVYDVCHNIAKIEEYEINEKLKKVCVHRKGATRAFPPDSKLIPDAYKEVGQPVLIPGDMGRYSFVCVGTEKAIQETFGSSCHGAGRLLSRNKAMKEGKGRNLIKELNDKGIIIQAKGISTIAEEMPSAYKDVANVVDVMHNAGITLKVARLKPVGVIKG